MHSLVDGGFPGLTGMAACPALGLVATASFETDAVDVYAIQQPLFTLRCSFHGHFRFDCMGYRSGWMSFSNVAPYVLYVSDLGKHAVHALDVQRVVHAGHVGTGFSEPSGVAAFEHLVAAVDRGRRVLLFETRNSWSWVLLRSIHVGIDYVQGIRFARDGASLALVSLKGSLVQVATDKGWSVVYRTWVSPAYDLEQYGDGWLVATKAGVYLVGRNDEAQMVIGSGRHCQRLAMVPGHGLAVIVDDYHTWLVPSPMEAMSAARTQWMGAVARSGIYICIGGFS